MSVSKMILWEIEVTKNKLTSLERRPNIFDEWEDGIYEELSYEMALKRVHSHDSAEALNQPDLVN